MNKQERLTQTECAVRWCSNILTEVLGNHGREIGLEAREHLSKAVQSLAECHSQVRKASAG